MQHKSITRAQQNPTSDHASQKPRDSSLSLGPSNSYLKTLDENRNTRIHPLVESGFVHAKLKIGDAAGKSEREADETADKIMRMPEPASQSLDNATKDPSSGGQSIHRMPEENEEEIQTKPDMTSTKFVEESPSNVAAEINRKPLPVTNLLQKMEEEEEEIQTKPDSTNLIQKQEEEEEEAIQTKSNSVQSPVSDRNSIAPANVESQINRMQGGGQPLSKSSQSYFEPRFGESFENVRVHTGRQAEETSAALNAQAFTRGSDIFFGSGHYQPDSHSGRKLLAHELTHVVQQGASSSLIGTKKLPGHGEKSKNNIIQKKSNPAPTDIPTATEKDLMPKEVFDLKGQPKFPATEEIDEYLKSQKQKRGLLKVKFGKLAEGTIEVQRDGKNKIKTRKQQPLPLNLPFFKPLQRRFPELEPSLLLNISKNKIKGGIGIKDNKLLKGNLFKKNPELLGLSGFVLPKVPSLVNKIQDGSLILGPNTFDASLGGMFSTTITLELKDESINSFEANANLEIEGLVNSTLNLSRNPEGVLSGNVDVAVQLPKEVSGNVKIFFNGESITGTGTVGYQGEKLSGNVTLNVMEAEKADKLEAEKKAPPEGEGETPAVAEAPKKKKDGRKKSKTQPSLVVFGDGELDYSFSDWLTGKAQVIVDRKGFLTVIGKITPQAEIPLFEQKDYRQNLFETNITIPYGLKVVGNVNIFAGLGIDGVAKLGPGKFHNITVDGTYSTDPQKSQNFDIRGSLNISAYAGLELRGEGGVGVEILDHDLKAGAGVTASAGLKGYVEATPIVGYREKPSEQAEDKKGEFFLRGDMEIAAQPVFGLSGDLFVEVDSPWWSPLPDKRWTWPLFNKEYPLGQSYAIGASIDYVFGSGKAPGFKFQPAKFDASKFYTDLYSDKAKKKSGGGQEKQGAWKEKNTKQAEPPPKVDGKGTAELGKGETKPEAKTKVKPGGPKKQKRGVGPNAKTAEGKLVKNLEKETKKRGGKPKGTKDPKGAANAEDTTAASKNAEHNEKLIQGLKALDAVTNRYAEMGANEEEIKGGVKSVRRKFKVFKSIEPIEENGFWYFHYTASPKSKQKGPKANQNQGVEENAKAAHVAVLKEMGTDKKYLKGHGNSIVGHAGHSFSVKNVRDPLNTLGYKYGDHNTGVMEPGWKGLKSGSAANKIGKPNWTPDHQPPDVIGRGGAKNVDFRFYPHSRNSIFKQSAIVKQYKQRMMEIRKKGPSKWAEGVESKWFHSRNNPKSVESLVPVWEDLVKEKKWGN